MSEIERAIKVLEKEYAFALECDDTQKRSSALHTALTVLRAELEREKNEPLTIEEILDMNGKPVWCQTGDGYEGWALVIVDKYQDGGHYLYLFSDDLTRDGINECFEPDEDFINLKFSDDPDGHFGLHVLGWRAYRYEPKGNRMYNGLTTADKTALMDAKARGAEWVARDEDGQICEYQYKPVKFISKIWKQGWWSRYGVPHSLMFDGEVLPFVKWSDPEPVNIDLAIAQIAEVRE